MAQHITSILTTAPSSSGKIMTSGGLCSSQSSEARFFSRLEEKLVMLLGCKPWFGFYVKPLHPLSYYGERCWHFVVGTLIGYLGLSHGLVCRIRQLRLSNSSEPIKGWLVKVDSPSEKKMAEGSKITYEKLMHLASLLLISKFKKIKYINLKTLLQLL